MEGMQEIKSLIEAQGTAWEEFKKTNDEVIKAKADGKAVGDLETKLEKIGKDMDKLGEVRDNLDKLEARINRKSLNGGAEEGDLDSEVKSFNIWRNAGAEGKQLNRGDIDVTAVQAYKKAYTSYVRANGNIDMLSPSEQKDMQAGSAPDGGFFTPPADVGRIVKKVYELSPIRQLASAIQISGLALEGVYDNDQAGYGWTSELGARPKTSTPQIGKYRIEANEMYAMPQVSQQLLDDAAVDIGAWLNGKVADRFARVEGAAFITGTGVGQPFGYTSYPVTVITPSTAGTGAWGTIEAIKTGVSSDFAVSSPADILFDLIQSFKTAYLQNASWVTLRAVIAKIRKFKEATTNAYMWQPGLAKGVPDTLLGYPITIAQDTPALAAGSLSMSFGDFREAYQIVDRIGIRTLRDPYTAKPNVLFYSTRRVGGAVVNFEAIKHIQFGT